MTRQTALYLLLLAVMIGAMSYYSPNSLTTAISCTVAAVIGFAFGRWQRRQLKR